MDGVLVDSRAVVERTWHRWADRHGLDAALLIDAAHGRRTGDTLREVMPELATPSEIAWLDDQELVDFDWITAVPGAPEFLAHLGEKDWALVTSSGRELALKRLSVAGLPMPPVMVCGEDVKRGKPDPEPYLAGAIAIGRPNAACIVFEDAPAGVAAGIASGASVIGIATPVSASAPRGRADGGAGFQVNSGGAECCGLDGSPLPHLTRSPTGRRGSVRTDERRARREGGAPATRHRVTRVRRGLECQCLPLRCGRPIFAAEQPLTSAARNRHEFASLYDRWSSRRNGAGVNDGSGRTPGERSRRLPARDRHGPTRGSSTELTVKSPAFTSGGDIPFENTQYKANKFPGFSWSAGPTGTKSYVIIMQDGDALRSGAPILHWTMINIPATVMKLDPGMTAPPAGAQNGPNMRGADQAYLGPRTPAGPKHRYHIQVFAMNNVISVTSAATYAGLVAAMLDHVLASGQVIGLGQVAPQE